MKRLCATLLALAPLAASHAGTTIDSAHKYSFAANLGWMDWTGDTIHGAVIGEYVCSGYVYSANVGWISLGSGSPADGIYYQNNSSSDFGVNQDGQGNLRGYAYSANVGWIQFEVTGAPVVDMKTGRFSGYAYSANCGWLSLSNATAVVQTDSIQPGPDANHDGIPDAWELDYFGTTNIDVNADADGDGVSNLREYLDGTSPIDANSVLKITAFNFLAGGNTTSLTWNSVPTRYYQVQLSTDLGAEAIWVDCGVGLIAPTGSSTSASFPDMNAPARFYRIEAVRPLFGP
jgi:hypothetical protein